MIGYLEGEVIARRPDWLILKVGGVGYKVYSVGFDGQIGQSLAIYTFDLVREDRRELYGFASLEALELFETMIEVNGVGPKLAAKILSNAAHDSVIEKILAGDVDFLTGIPGVGKKTAQKIILELKGVLVTESDEPNSVDEEAIDALVGLGYARRDVADVLRDVVAESTEDRIRAALKQLSR